MDYSFILSISSIFEKRKQGRSQLSFFEGEERAGVDAKVQGLVKPRISSGLGSLFVSVTAPFALSDFRSSLRNLFRFKKKESLFRLDALWSDVDGIPLGLMACGLHSWINAVMQIALRLPVFRTILLLWAPHSYEPFLRFIDQHDADREAKLMVSSASSADLVRCLAQKMLPELFVSWGNPDLFEVFRKLLLSCVSKESLSLGVYSKEESCCLVEWDQKIAPLDAFIQQKLEERAPWHLLVFIKHPEDLETLPKQIADEKGQYYALRGFIEKRQDVGFAEFIAYVKVSDKNWYQCRNQRILKLQSIHLHIPLQSSHLLYYKRCP